MSEPAVAMGVSPADRVAGSVDADSIRSFPAHNANHNVRGDSTLLACTQYATTGFWVGSWVGVLCFWANGSGSGSKAERAF